MYVGSLLFIFNNDTPLLLQNKIRLVSPLKEIDFSKIKKIKNTWLPGTCRKSLGSNNYLDFFEVKKRVGILEKVLVSTLAPMFLFWELWEEILKIKLVSQPFGVGFLWGRKIDHFLPHKNCHTSIHPQPTHTVSMSLYPDIPTIKPVYTFY